MSGRIPDHNPRWIEAEWTSTSYEQVVEVVKEIRTAKGREGITVGTPVTRIDLRVPTEWVPSIEAALSDIGHVARASEVAVTPGQGDEVEVALGAALERPK